MQTPEQPAIGLPSVDTLLTGMAEDLRAQLARRGIAHPAMVGIHTGGAWLAERLHGTMELSTPLGLLDISFYRDDFTRSGLNPQVRPTELPFAVDDRHIILVDDVLMSGRTIRAALNALFDYGRPASVLLCVLVDLDAHELPIAPDVSGCRMALPPEQRLKLRGPEPLILEQVSVGTPRA